MTNLREKQKAEALKRMEMLKMDQTLIDALKNDTVFYSENMGAPMDAIWFSLGKMNEDTEQYKEFMALIKKLEEGFGAFAYHGQLSHTVDGDVYILLYVSAHEDEWEMERADLTLQKDPNHPELEYCYPIVYAKSGFCTEFGSVQLKPSIGGVCRC